MPQPAAVDQAAEELRRAYQEAWKRVLDEEIRLMTDPLQATKTRRLMEMRREIEAEMDALDEQLGKISGRAVQKAYALGAEGPIRFTGIHREAVQQMVQGLTNDLLKATQHVRDTTKTLIRQVARSEGLQKLIEGKTALGAAREMRKILEAHKIHAVVYADGSKHGLAEYANMQMRTTTAIAYNQGTLNSATEKGTLYFEVSDGTDCGWDGHEDSDKANGRIVHRDEAASHVISHPSCRRAFGGRPELRTASEARKAEEGTKARAEAQRRSAAERAGKGAKPAPTPPAPKSEIPSRHEAVLKRHAQLAGTPAVVEPPSVPVRTDVTKPSQYVQTRVVTNPKRGVGKPIGPRTRVQVAVERAQKLIDEVHLSPNLLDPKGRSAELRTMQISSQGTLGIFHRSWTPGDSADRYAVAIGVSSFGQAQEFCYAHEFGHFFDFADFDQYGHFATGMSDWDRDANPILDGFWKSVDESQAYQTLLDMRANPAAYRKVVSVGGRDVAWRVDSKHLRYLQRPREVWARAYSQWIAEKTGDEAMLRGLGRFLESPYPAQWSPEDFAPISAAMDELFRSQGLML